MVYRAQLLIEGEKASVASQELRDFVRRSPEAVLAWYYLGKSEQRLSRLDSAIVAMKRAVEIRPTFHQAQLSLGYLHESKGDTKTAIALYQKVFDQSQDQNAANRLATLLLKEEKFAEAVRYLEAIEAADPEDMNSRVKLGLILMELKRYPDAIKRFEEILAKYPDSERINYYLGNLYQETGELDRAIAQLQKIDEKSKLFSDASLHIASLYRISKKFEQAKAAIHRGIRVSPRTSGFYLLGANISDELGEPAEAINLLERGVAMLPEDEKLHYYLGSLYDKQGRVDEGLVQIEAILKINPNNVDALNYVGYTWAVRGVRLNEAEKLLKKAVALKPDNAYIRDSWGYLLLVRGRLRESIIEFELAARLKPNEPVILEHLADAYLKSNLREKAFATYSEALKYATDETLRSQLDQKIQGLKVQLARESADQRNPASASSGPSAKLPE
jgi:tetratricopeptide (TPR) repeat protein